MRRASKFLCIWAAAAATSASAQTFAPHQPPPCGSGWSPEVPWKYRMGYATNHSDPASDRSNVPLNKNGPVGCPGGGWCDYIPNVHQTRTFVANQWVGQVQFKVKMLRTEPINDYFQATFPPPWKQSAPRSGDLTPGTPPAAFWLRQSNGLVHSFQSRPLQLIFHSDANDVTDRGVDIDGLQVCGNAAPNPSPAPIVPFQRATGVLLDTNDTVYLSLPASTDAAIHTALALQGQPGTNFDLYVKCNALPTPANWDRRGASVFHQEFVHLNDNACLGTWYLAVHSAAGRGWFNVIPSRHFVTSHKILRAGIGFPAGAQLPVIQQTLRETARKWYAATEGTDWIDIITVHDNVPCMWTAGNVCAGQYCDICITNHPGNQATCEYDPFNARMHIVTRTGAQSSDALVHELGHCQWKWSPAPWIDIADEYVPNGVGGVLSTCGHSVMAIPGGDNANFCSGLDHGRDGDPGAFGGPAFSVWDIAFSHPGTVPWKPTETPDNYSYADFDFNFLGGYGFVF